MSKTSRLRHEFVEFIPETLEDGVLYVSLPYATVTHRCCCGCGREVVTPLSPTDWRLTFDGESISLAPSIGNWNFPCRSHYWIEASRVQWSYRMTDEQIQLGRRADQRAKQRYYAPTDEPSPEDHAGPASDTGRTPSRWAALKAWLRGAWRG